MADRQRQGTGAHFLARSFARSLSSGTAWTAARLLPRAHVLASASTKPVVRRVEGERGVADISFKRAGLGALKKEGYMLVVRTFDIGKFALERRRERRGAWRRLLWELSPVVFLVAKAGEIDVIAGGQGLPTFSAFVKEHVATRLTRGVSASSGECTLICGSIKVVSPGGLDAVDPVRGFFFDSPTRKCGAPEGLFELVIAAMG